MSDTIAQALAIFQYEKMSTVKFDGEPAGR